MGSLPIAEVVVHRDGALVHRRGRLNVIAGAVVVTGLPMIVDEGSVRVEVVGTTPSGWRLSIDVSGLERGAEPEVDRALYEARACVARLEAKDTALATTRAMVFRVLPGAPFPEEQPTASRLVAWGRVAAGLAAWAAELDEGRIALVERLREAREQLHVAEQRAAQASSEDRYRFWVPSNRLAIAVEGEGELEVAVSYRVDGAAWVPTYALFADAGLRKARFLARALVAQATGEDWRGVKLAFSTAPSARVLDVPDLPALRLGKPQPPPVSPWRELPPGLDALFPADLHPLSEELDLLELAEPSPAVSMAFAMPPPGAPPPPPSPAPRVQSQSMPTATVAASMPSRGSPKGAGLLAGFGASVGAMVSAVGDLADDGATAAPSAAPSAARQSAKRKMDANLPGPLEVNPDLLDYSALRLGAFDGSSDKRGRLAPVDPADDLGLPAAGTSAVARARATQRGSRDQLRFDGLAGAHTLPGTIDEAAYRYDAAGVADVPSDERFHAVSLFEDELILDVRYRAVPRSDPRAFRTVRARLTHAVPLLAGPVDVHVDGALVLVAAWAGSAKGGEVVIGLGPEEGLKVARNVRYREESAGLMGGYRRIHTEVDVEIASSLGRTAEIELLDRLPITDDSEITVELVAASPAADVYKGDDSNGPILQGGRRQLVSVPAGGKVKANLHFTVTLGSKLEIDGGERR